MKNTFFFRKKSGSGFESFDNGNGNGNGLETLAAESGGEGNGSGDNGNLWDQAHAIKASRADIGYVEPDVTSSHFSPASSAFESGTDEDDTAYDDFWPFPKDEAGKPLKRIWHLAGKYSQLKDAWADVDTDKVIRIAHLDTGYDPGHDTCPAGIEVHLQRNYVEENNSAIDIGSEGWLKQPGHGPGTLSILAGNKIKLADYEHDDFIGIHKGIKVVPIRMSRSVILWKNKAFIDAMNYIISLYDDPQTRCHIVTMSMGGLPLKAWAEVVNKAYEKGIFIVTAAGNNFGRLTPNKVIYPARFNRVIAACGVNFDYSPYYRGFTVPGIDNMQGNFGPRKVMRTAVAAFTPNMPWARIGTKNKVSIRGAGTSSATPQIAAAAALYYQKHYDAIEALPQGWMKVEAIRRALMETAKKTIAPDYDDDVELYFGNGILQAQKMLAVKPVAAGLEKEEEDTVSWAFFRLITGFETMDYDSEAREMFETEMLQLVQQSKALQDILAGEEKDFSELSEEDQQRFYRTVQEMPQASKALKQFINSLQQ